MADPAEPDGQSYGLVMPFLPVASRGGPFDDQAYVAGYHMGALDAALQSGTVPDPFPLHPANREQADLIAMHHGCVVEFATTEQQEWLIATVTKGTGL